MVKIIFRTLPYQSPPSDLLGLGSLLKTGLGELKEESHVHSKCSFQERIKIKFLVKQIHIIIISKQIRAQLFPARVVTIANSRGADKGQG